MSKLTLYNGLKADLETITNVKHVALWNNQIERENEEHPFLYPAIFIEFIPSGFIEKGQRGNYQQYNLTVRLHICFESYLDDDTTILTLVDDVWQKVQAKQYYNFGKLLRREENQNFDHPNVQEYLQDYITLGQDELTDNLVSTTVAPILNPVEIIKPNEL